MEEWARRHSGPWPTFQEIALRWGQNVQDVATVIQNHWTTELAKRVIRGEVDRRDVPLLWRDQTGNIDQFTGRHRACGLSTGYCDWEQWCSYFEKCLQDAVTTQLFNHPGQYSLAELDQVVLTSGPFFSDQSRTSVLYDYMLRMQNLKNRGPEWRDRLSQLATDLGVVEDD